MLDNFLVFSHLCPFEWALFRGCTCETQWWRNVYLPKLVRRIRGCGCWQQTSSATDVSYVLPSEWEVSHIFTNKWKLSDGRSLKPVNMYGYQVNTDPIAKQMSMGGLLHTVYVIGSILLPHITSNFCSSNSIVTLTKLSRQQNKICKETRQKAPKGKSAFQVDFNLSW